MVAKQNGFWSFTLGLWMSVKRSFGIVPRENAPFPQCVDGSWHHLLEEKKAVGHGPPDADETLRALARLAQTNESGAVAPTDLMKLDDSKDPYAGELCDFESVIASCVISPRCQPFVG